MTYQRSISSHSRSMVLSSKGLSPKAKAITSDIAQQLNVVSRYSMNITISSLETRCFSSSLYSCPYRPYMGFLRHRPAGGASVTLLGVWVPLERGTYQFMRYHVLQYLGIFYAPILLLSDGFSRPSHACPLQHGRPCSPWLRFQRAMLYDAEDLGEKCSEHFGLVLRHEIQRKVYSKTSKERSFRAYRQ